MFGVSHIEVGFLQTITFNHHEATAGNPVQDYPMHENGINANPVLNGQTLIDVINKRPAGNYTYENLAMLPVQVTLPWYDPTGVTGGGSKGLFRSQEDVLVQNQTLKISDTPLNNGLSNPMFDLPNGGKIPINGYNIQWGLNVYVGVRTRDKQNNADRIYTQRAIGQWSFDGSGTFTGNTSTQFGTYTLTGNGVQQI
jgi:hypothetical protein